MALCAEPAAKCYFKDNRLMPITRVHAEHFRAFKSLDAEFKPPFTMLCGAKGSGKSSVLYAIAHSLVLSGNESGLTGASRLYFYCKDRRDYELKLGLDTGCFEYLGYQKSMLKRAGRTLTHPITSESITLDNVHKYTPPILLVQIEMSPIKISLG
ncbi:MAG: recombinational DNA repair ATPase RecF [Alteromonadaceae bacterium]|jgi:recombinational DNA repair ATPase RecF